jgi:hypothetical protein
MHRPTPLRRTPSRSALAIVARLEIEIREIDRMNDPEERRPCNLTLAGHRGRRSLGGRCEANRHGIRPEYVLHGNAAPTNCEVIDRDLDALNMSLHLLRGVCDDVGDRRSRTACGKGTSSHGTDPGAAAGYQATFLVRPCPSVPSIQPCGKQ